MTRVCARSASLAWSPARIRAASKWINTTRGIDDDQPSRLDRAVRDPGRVHRQDLVPHRVEEVVADVASCDPAESSASQPSGDHQRVVGCRPAPADQLLAGHSGSFARHQHQALVLSQLLTRCGRRRTRTAVPHRSPHATRERGLGGVAAIDLDQQVLIVARPDLHDRRPSVFAIQVLELVDGDADLIEGGGDARLARYAEPGAEHQMDGRRGEHAQRQSAERRRQRAVAQHDRGEGHRGDDLDPDAPHRQ